MAEVFAGYALGDHGFQKPCAIKRLLPELASDHVFVERLIEEAKLLVGMQHGNIVSVLDLARDGDDVFLVMEFVDGPASGSSSRRADRAGCRSASRRTSCRAPPPASSSRTTGPVARSSTPTSARVTSCSRRRVRSASPTSASRAARAAG